MKKRKITVEMVMEAYKTKDLLPYFGSFNLARYAGKWNAPTGMCCALGALLVGERDNECGVEEAVTALYDVNFWAFVEGFDGLSLNNAYRENEVAKDSYDLGQSCRKAVKERYASSLRT